MLQCQVVVKHHRKWFYVFFFFSLCSLKWLHTSHHTGSFPGKRVPRLMGSSSISRLRHSSCSGLVHLYFLWLLLDSFSFPHQQLIASWTRFVVPVGMDHICRRPTVCLVFFYLSPAVTRGATCLLVRRSGTDAPFFSEGLASNWLLLFIDCGSDFETHTSTFHWFADTVFDICLFMHLSLHVNDGSQPICCLYMCHKVPVFSLLEGFESAGTTSSH